MRISSLLLAVASFTALAFASPLSDVESRSERCLSSADAHFLVKAYTRLISAYTDKEADKYLSDSFVEYSDSIGILNGVPLGQPIFPTKAHFKAAGAAQPPFPLVVESVVAKDCKAIVLTFTATFGAGLPIRGVAALTTTYERHWKISRIDVELNSIAYLINIGGSIIPPGV